VNLISDRFQPYHAFVGVLREVSLMSNGDWNVQLRHTLWEGNHCADFFAKIGSSHHDLLKIVTLCFVELKPTSLVSRIMTAFLRDSPLFLFSMFPLVTQKKKNNDKDGVTLHLSCGWQCVFKTNVRSLKQKKSVTIWSLLIKSLNNKTSVLPFFLWLNYTFSPRVLTYSRNWSCLFKTEQNCPSIINSVAFFILPPILSSKNADVSHFLMRCPKKRLGGISMWHLIWFK